MQGPPGHWRPPRPRAFDWLTGASSSGFLLGLIQLVLEAPSLTLPPGLAFALILTTAAMVTGVAILIPLLLRWTPIPVTHDTLVGGVLASLAVVALSGPALASWKQSWPLLGLGGLSVLVAVGFAGTWFAGSRAWKRPASALPTWAGAALLLAGAAHLLASAGAWWIYVAVAAGLVITVLGLLGTPIPGQVAPRTSFGSWCLGLLVAAIVAPFWPWWLPWALLDRDLPDLPVWPPNFLIVVLEEPEPQSSALLEILASQAIVYERLYPGSEPLPLLALPDGATLASRLRDYGYATAIVASQQMDGLGEGFAEIDARPGGKALLAESSAWMAGAALVLWPGSPLAGLLGHDRPLRSPEELGASAALWLQDWRISRAPTPFQLLVDFRSPDAQGDSVDAGLTSVLDALREQQLEYNTLIAVAITSPAPAAELRGLVIPPYSWRPPVAREVVTLGLSTRELSRSLFEIALGSSQEPIRFPGSTHVLSAPSLGHGL